MTPTHSRISRSGNSVHCSQRIIIKDIHRLTPPGGSLKYAIFDDRILFFAFALCSVHKLTPKYFIVNPFFQVNKNSYFFQVLQRYMYAYCTSFLVKTKYFYHRHSRRSDYLFLFSSDRNLRQKHCGKYQPTSCQLPTSHLLTKYQPTGNDREYRLKAHNH